MRSGGGSFARIGVYVGEAWWTLHTQQHPRGDDGGSAPDEAA
jgi:hypothetical protein